MRVLLIAALMVGCTDADLGKIGAYGNGGTVKCYSGERLIYEGASTGKIENSAQSDGYYFLDSRTRRLVEVSGNCVVVYKQ